MIRRMMRFIREAYALVDLTQLMDDAKDDEIY